MTSCLLPWNWGLLLKKRICSSGSKFFPLRVDPLNITGKHEDKGVASPESIPIHLYLVPGCVAQSVGHLTHKSGVLGSIPGLATYFRFSFRFFKKGICLLLAKVCARSTG